MILEFTISKLEKVSDMMIDFGGWDGGRVSSLKEVSHVDSEVTQNGDEK